MSTAAARIGISFTGGEEADAEGVADATRQLRRELLELDVDSVDMPRSENPPPGSRGADAAALGAVVDTVQSWLARSRQGTIKLELGGDVLELTGVSSQEQRRLTDEWLRRHGEVTG